LKRFTIEIALSFLIPDCKKAAGCGFSKDGQLAPDKSLYPNG